MLLTDNIHSFRTQPVHRTNCNKYTMYSFHLANSPLQLKILSSVVYEKVFDGVVPNEIENI